MLVTAAAGPPDRWQYLAVLAGCLLVTLPLELVIGARVYRQPRRLVRALAPAVALFTLWDVIAIARGHWGYNPRYVTGWRLPGALPVEELAFFLVVPICALLTYEAVTIVLARARRGPLRARATTTDTTRPAAGGA
ncbi:MAG TPA: lycopene cyclase domain-containing protein [Acidimicrobiales bacterium]|nr:lycopene cyclase domain-containing protein [Acidimicrobiales bacterium]